MAVTSWPWDLQEDGVTPAEVDEGDFRWTLAASSQSGVWEDQGDGLVVAALADSTGVTVGSGRGQVRGYGFRVDTTEEVPAPANASSDPCLYWLAARLDRAAHKVELVVVEGTPAPSPALPALTRTDTVWELPLAAFRRAGGGGGITNLVDHRLYLNPHGPVKCASGARPQDPGAGDEAYETDTGRKIRYHAGTWVADADPTYPTGWTNIPLSSGIVAYRTKSGGFGYWPRYQRLSERRVELRGLVARSSGNFSGTSVTIGRLPAGVRPTEITYTVGASAQSSAEGQNQVRLEVQPDGDIRAYIVSGYTPSWISLDNWVFETS